MTVRLVKDGDQFGWDPAKPSYIARGGEPPHDDGMEARVAVLEQIAKTTEATLKEIRDDLREMRKEARADAAAHRSSVDDLRKQDISSVKWLLGLGATAFAAAVGLMAKGFHWY